MRFDQALARAAALKTSDPRFAYVTGPDASVLLVRGEGFCSSFQVTEGIVGPASGYTGFTGDLKTVATAVRISKAKVFVLQFVGDAPAQLCWPAGDVGVAPLIDPGQFWPQELPTYQIHEVSPHTLKVLLAVAQRASVKDVLRPPLQCVHFCTSYIEAGDEAQFCRAFFDVDVGDGGFMVPADRFQKIKVLLSSAPRLWLGSDFLGVESHGECRLITVLSGVYPDLGPYFDKSTPKTISSVAVADVKDLASALNTFKQKAQRKFLRLTTDGKGLLSLESRTTDIHASVPVVCDGVLDVVVQGDRLTSVVRSWQFPKIHIQRAFEGGVQAPLIFRAPDCQFFEYLYPLLEAGGS